MESHVPSILIIDDNILFIDRMTVLLREVNMRSIDAATHYEEALSKLEAHRFDVILLDINLPGKNGVELLRKIRQARYPGEIIMLSNHADEYYRRICMDLGVTYFLDKSNDFSLVPGIIKNMKFNDYHPSN